MENIKKGDSCYLVPSLHEFPLPHVWSDSNTDRNGRAKGMIVLTEEEGYKKIAWLIKHANDY